MQSPTCHVNECEIATVNIEIVLLIYLYDCLFKRVE